MFVITTDGSKRSLNVIPHAARLARVVDQDVTSLRVFDPDALPSATGEWTERLHAGKASLEAEMALLLRSFAVAGSTHAEALLKGESVPDAILRCVGDLGARLLAMDTRGHGVLRHALLGSVAMDVLHHSTRPVMVTGSAIAPAPEHDRYVIVATSDGSAAAEQVFAALSDVCTHPGVRVALVSVYVPSLGDQGEQAEVQQRYALLDDLQRRLLPGARCEIIVRRAHDLTKPESMVLDTARDLNASAIAMSTKGHSASRHVVLGSFAAAVVANSELPVILAKA